MLIGNTTKSFIVVRARGRVPIDAPKIYTIVQCMPVEADGRL
jgi:hypothetical protein